MLLVRVEHLWEVVQCNFMEILPIFINWKLESSSDRADRFTTTFSTEAWMGDVIDSSSLARHTTLEVSCYKSEWTNISLRLEVIIFVLLEV